MKDLGLLRYFLGIEVARSLKSISLSQRKMPYLLEETGTLGSKPIGTPMDPNSHFDQNLGESLADPGEYRRLIDKLIYLIVTRPDIIFVVGVLSRYI